MPETAIDAKRELEEWKTRRNLLLRIYLKNPLETRLALEIKVIDDPVAASVAR